MSHIVTGGSLRRMRESSGITQAELARLAGVSQAHVAKIERGKVDPRLSTVNSLLRVLEKREKTRTCGDVMRRGVMSLKPEDTAERAISMMKRFGISQAPVMKGGKSIGSVSEGTVMRNMGRNLKRLRVAEMMEPAFPVVDAMQDADALLSMLEFNPAVLVTEKGEIVGIVTKLDMLGGK